jgi:hypothetical protein
MLSGQRCDGGHFNSLQAYALQVEYHLHVYVEHAQPSFVSSGIHWYWEGHFVEVLMSEFGRILRVSVLKHWSYWVFSQSDFLRFYSS